MRNRLQGRNWQWILSMECRKVVLWGEEEKKDEAVDEGCELLVVKEVRWQGFSTG